MNKTKILLVDDDPNIRQLVSLYLTREGFEVQEAQRGDDALKQFKAAAPNLILLDIMLPGIDGMEVCRRLKGAPTPADIPIIMLTAKGEDMDKILGLEYGADDYMTKPFNILEVKARIKSILRRTGQMNRSDARTITVRDMVINLNNRSVVVGDRDVNLTAKEFDLLQLFATNRGKVFSREALLETIWKYDYLGDLRTVDVHIRRLREKIEKNPAQPEFIFTKWGVGYYFTDKD